MKNHLHHESLISPSYSNADSCLPNRCKLVIPLFFLASMAVFNFWRFLLNGHDFQVLYDSNSVSNDRDPPFLSDSDAISVSAAAAADFCNSRSMGIQSCDIFKGKWVPDPRPPLYTNETCPYIFPNQDCMTRGRPDRGFIHWKWQPHDCDIPTFDPTLFLQLMMGKKMVFVGDSLARNQMQSLLCSIVQVESPQDVLSEHQGMEYAWNFPSFNFTLAMSWSPFLVNYTVEEGTWKIHVDRPDETWTSSLSNYEVAVFSTMYWFFRRSIYYVKGKSVSEYDPSNVTSIEEVHIMKHVWSSVLEHLVENYEGVAVIRTPSVSHYDGNPWDKGGTCYKTQPDFDPHMNMSLPWTHNEILKIQKNEFMKALNLASSRNSKSSCHLKLLDVTYSTLLRPDGHPSTYRIQSATEPRNDCVHWCMPGPIDTWNQLLFADPQIMCS